MEKTLRALVACDNPKCMRYMTTILMDVEGYGEVDQIYDNKTLLSTLQEEKEILSNNKKLSGYDLYFLEIDEAPFEAIYELIKDRIESEDAKLIVFLNNEVYVQKAREIIPEYVIKDTFQFLGNF